MIRLKYEELFGFTCKINYLKEQNKKNAVGIKRECNKMELDKVIKKLPFKLTDDQIKALDEIIDDLSSDHKMNRLLQGDVGSGKTIVAFLAMYYNSICGYQSALMKFTFTGRVAILYTCRVTSTLFSSSSVYSNLTSLPPEV